MLVELSNSEIDALYMWHREQQWESSRKEQYLDADDHKKRADELAEMLKVPNAGNEGPGAKRTVPLD